MDDSEQLADQYRGEYLAERAERRHLDLYRLRWRDLRRGGLRDLLPRGSGHVQQRVRGVGA